MYDYKEILESFVDGPVEQLAIKYFGEDGIWEVYKRVDSMSKEILKSRKFSLSIVLPLKNIKFPR